MCDEHTEQENSAYLRAAGKVSRRRFTVLTAGAAVALAVPASASAPVGRASAVIESDVQVATPDGTADCYFVHPASGRHPGIIVWPDILGLRPAFRLMGKRLAESGYAVLVINPYYRQGRAPVVAEGASFQDPAVREQVMPLAMSLSADTNVTDAKAFVAFLDQQAAVDSTRKLGTTGYCMGGPMVMRTAATLPERIGAGASFHGSRLVMDGPDSPHLLVPQMRAGFLFAIAENDDEREPEAKSVLRRAYDEAGLPAEIEVYQGAMHGWCVLDSAVYHQAQAERAWARMLALFERALV
ncbi:MAG: dienelactone hydrolase family protein [Pseudomonadales bacterium]